MIGRIERKRDVLKLVEELDISPSMYENAEKKYKALADYLGRHTRIQTTMYPQGSFAFGTVVRPLKDGREAAYDLDFICEVDEMRDEISPEGLRKIIKDALTESILYGGKLEVFDECFTIHYAEEGGAEFSIDIVPAASESDEIIGKLKNKAERPDLLETSISIPMLEDKKYVWETNNPKGFLQWFNEINQPYLDSSRNEFRKSLFESTDIYNTVEEIPAGLERSAVQRVIQILKRHRDNFYSNFSDIKPISAIINVLVADVAKSMSPDTDVFMLLEYVLDDVMESSKYYDDRLKGEMLLEHRIVGRKCQGWYIGNPANPEDNLASAWNENENIPKKFFKWIQAAKEDLIDSMDVEDDEFRAISENAFGQEAVRKSWGDKYNTKKAEPIRSSAKPWRE